ncbi:GGDEF domain-containing protein [Pseudoalteromonas carrageenovora]|uniref:GGDEF domain-containing protein n=1 Tax=Pseudoalteromonas carrageenovora TaxID=227 RepID=UPI0026E366F6|nr:GGDEF domain-containing protein [Pseudoalteromonas carrageenovora]MDO6635452.1 GGDEF domain-containing protein [Pseudoalteromonas carrageenovora]MDO6647533.1 GGDEF domain-containing protein [Pseudoalteromonas carrageenovora]
MDIAALNSTKSLRKSVLSWMCLCFGFLSFAFAVFNLTVNNFALLGYIEVFFSIYCFFTYISLLRRPLRFWQSIVMCALITLIVILATTLATPHNGVFVWSFALPILFYLLLGKQYGVVLSASLLVIQSYILGTKSSLSPFTTFNLSLNLMCAYLSIWAISHVFEGSRAHFSKRLKNLALLDPLTGAGNRLSMNHYFEVELQDKSQLYVFLLDLDFFKQVNDKHGHAVGDQVLVEVATLLRVTLGKGYVFRVGGEEFALFCSFPHEDEALNAAEKIRADIENTHFKIDGLVINITTSIGVAKFRSSNTLEGLINQADKQLYKAKRFGRNKVYCKFKKEPKLEKVIA